MKKFLIALGLATALAGLVLADAEHYETLTAAPTDYRGSSASPLDGADSTDWSTPILAGGPANRTSLIATKGNPTVYVSADLSVSGATATVTCGLYAKVGSTYNFLGIAGVSTATAGTNTRASGRFVAPSLVFDTSSATHVELRKTDPSDSATITLRPWVAGKNPAGAGQ